MVFSSSVFLFLFLPIFLAIYYVVPFRLKSWVILVGSYSFYAWWRVDFLALFIAVTLWNYCLALKVSQHIGTNRKKAKQWLTLAIAGNLSTLAYFKYANFGVESLNSVLTSLGASPLPLANIILPIGISFYIFQAISYVVDVYRKDVPVTTRLIDFAAFIALFPQLIAGPVLRYKDVAEQFASRTHSFALFGEGVLLFMIGFIKKVLIADSVAAIADESFLLSEPSFADAWLGAIAYSIQLYFDFSGYSDMACGLGLMMGFRFIQNFNRPYVSLSITEFWRRWHISLSTWLRDYLYIPLGGSRGSNLLTYRNLLLTMLLGGLWHGANWTFILWGTLHGSILALERVTGWSKGEKLKLVRFSLTMLIVIIGWVAFRANDVQQAFEYYVVMFDFSAIDDLAVQLNPSYRATCFLAVGIGYILIENLATRFNHISMSMPNLMKPALVLGLFALSVSKLIASAYSPFLYFQF
ncbi:poly(beta-D-mannuronate) O-acetylase [Vibrio ponticus]|uniref:Probable alginate O-acetylase n=1 Tax=Vibrio ponticus TaxID=265668 RepID=A0ABX3FAD7_9VIBR|nr:MBOAT family protein [Vibrio ponticus]OLQ85510.1 poly(beta-D-mannuronate) O-acetylase [Vibrio ponticus]